VDQHRRKISRQFQRGLIVAGPITLIGLVFGLTTPDSDLREIALVVALMAGIVVIVSIYQLWSYRDEDNVGRRKALALHQPALEEQGYDSFWAQFSLDELKERLAREQG